MRPVPVRAGLFRDCSARSWDIAQSRRSWITAFSSPRNDRLRRHSRSARDRRRSSSSCAFLSHHTAIRPGQGCHGRDFDVTIGCFSRQRNNNRLVVRLGVHRRHLQIPVSTLLVRVMSRAVVRQARLWRRTGKPTGGPRLPDCTSAPVGAGDHRLCGRAPDVVALGTARLGVSLRSRRHLAASVLFSPKARQAGVRRESETCCGK